jgi:hypothetical protein
MKERLRTEPRRRPVVVVGIVDKVRVELDLAIVEVEVRSVVEANIGIQILFLPIRGTRARSNSCWKQDTISLLNFI